MDDQIENYRCATEMSDAMISDRIKDGRSADVAKTNAGPPDSSERPGKTPAVAVEHW